MRHNQHPIVVGIGEILWDLLPSGKRLGGAPANFAYHAGVLGADAYVVSRIGDDTLGREILAEIDRLNLHRRWVLADRRRPTGTVSVELDHLGQPAYIIHENVAWDYLTASPDLIEFAGKADAVCFGSLAQRLPDSRRAIQTFLAATSEQCLRIFDINLRQHYYNTEVIDAGIRFANALKLNDAELPVVAELLGIGGSEDEILEVLLHRYGLKVIALTLGEKGAVLVAPGQRSVQPGMLTKVVDTVGAGDAFTAALVMGLLENAPLEEINRRACRLASYVCGQAGAMPNMSRKFMP